MTALSDTQLVILSAAARREDRNVLPLPGSLRGGAATKVVGALLSRGLIAETTTDSQTKADAALNRFWRNDEDGRATLLHISAAGLVAIGIDPDGGDSAPTRANEAISTQRSASSSPEAGDEAAQPATQRPGTKQAALIAMLRTSEGATLDEIVAATGWQKHTARGAMSGALKKRLGLTITSEQEPDRGRVYRIPPDEGS